MRSGDAKVDGPVAASAQHDSNASTSCQCQSRAITVLYWACGAIFALLVVLGLFMCGPQVEADEGSYLLNAAAIAGRLSANPPNGYYSGYSLLLYPAFLFNAGPEHAYHVALVINALLVASIPLALYSLTRQLWPDSGSDTAHTMVALAATCYAPMLMLSQHTMSESALACAFAWLLACTTTALRTTRLWPAMGAGAFAGFLFLVHARGATMVAPILFAATTHAIVHPRGRRVVAIFWLVAVAVAMLHGPLETAAGRGHMSSAGMLREMLARIASPVNWKWLLFNFVGSTTEAIVSSMGVAVIAARAVLSETRSIRLDDDFSLRTTILAATAAAMLVALTVTAAFFTPPERADQLAYGRYALPTLIPLLAVGLLRLAIQRTSRKRDFSWALVVGIAGIAGTGVAYRSLPQAAQANWNFVNSIDLYLFHDIAHLNTPWLAIALCFVVLLGILAVAFLQRGYIGVAVYAGSQLVIFTIAWSTVTQPGSQLYASDRGVVDAVRAFADAGERSLCVRLSPDVDSWHRTDISWRLFPHVVTSPMTNCIDAMIGPLKYEQTHGRRLVAFERPSPLGNNVPIGLFLSAGTDFEDFARVVATPPENALQPVAVEDRFAEVSITDSLPLRATVGVPIDLHVRIANRGRHALPAIDASRFLPYPILLGAQVELDGKRFEYRAAVPEAINPGQATDAIIRLGPFDQIGHYTLRVGVLQEHVAWYEGAAREVLEVGHLSLKPAASK